MTTITQDEAARLVYDRVRTEQEYSEVYKPWDDMTDDEKLPWLAITRLYQQVWLIGQGKE